MSAGRVCPDSVLQAHWWFSRWWSIKCLVVTARVNNGKIMIMRRKVDVVPTTISIYPLKRDSEEKKYPAYNSSITSKGGSVSDMPSPIN